METFLINEGGGYPEMNNCISEYIGRQRAGILLPSMDVNIRTRLEEFSMLKTKLLHREVDDILQWALSSNIQEPAKKEFILYIRGCKVLDLSLNNDLAGALQYAFCSPKSAKCFDGFEAKFNNSTTDLRSIAVILGGLLPDPNIFKWEHALTLFESLYCKINRLGRNSHLENWYF